MPSKFFKEMLYALNIQVMSTNKFSLLLYLVPQVEANTSNPLIKLLRDMKVYIWISQWHMPVYITYKGLSTLRFPILSKQQIYLA